MILGTAFIIEVAPEREEEILTFLRKRIFNYPVIKKIPGGFFATSLDGAALTMPLDYGWSDFCKPGLVIRIPDVAEQMEIVDNLWGGTG